MEGNSQQQKLQSEKPIELMDLNDTVIETIFGRFEDKDLVNVARTCKRLQRIVRNYLPKKYRKALKIISTTEVSLHTRDFIRCPTIKNVTRLYPHTEILHLDTYDEWEELCPIAQNLQQLRELDLNIYVMGFNHIFHSAKRIERMLCIAFDKQLPIQRLKMDMEFGYIVNMLWMIAENLTQLKELELIFQYEMCVGEIEDEDSLRFKTLEKLSVHCARHIGEKFAAMRSIAMFEFDQLKEFTLKGLHDPPTDAIDFIVRQRKLQKLKLIDCTDVNVKVLSEIKGKLPHLKEIVTDVDEQSKEKLKQQFGSRWMVSEQLETYEEKLRKTWRFTLNEN